MRPRRLVARLRNAVALLVTASLLLNFETPAGSASPQSPQLPPAGSVTYSYDAAGRLVGASEPGVGSVTHSYDAAGNLTATTPSTGTDPQLLSVSPQHATPGSTVTLRGANFSSTASNDQVSFGGTAATVGSAAAGSLTVTVPSAATSGPVTVTVGGVTATGPAFTVDPSAQAPTISGFSAGQASPGATLTISGSHFDPSPARDVVQVNQIRAPVTAATASSLTISVPQAAVGSGKVSVSTPAGVATSSTDLYVLPAALAASTFDAGQRLTPPGTVTMTTSGSGHVALAVFDAPANGRLFVREGTSSVPSCDGTLTIYDPHGVSIGSDSCVWTKDYLDDLPLRTAGTYTVALSTNGAGGSVPVTLDLVAPDSTAATTTDGTPKTITTSIGQTANLTFSGTSGQRIFVKITGNTAEATNCAALTLAGPSGTVVTGNACSATAYIDTTTLPADGGYTLTFNPGGTDSGSATIAIYTVSADSSTAVNADGTRTTVTTSIGQSAKLTFAGTSGQRVFLNFTGITANATNCPTFTLLDPSGSSVVNKLTCSASDYFDTTALPADGTYTLVFNPGGIDSGNATIAIYTVPADSSTAVNADGTPTTVTTSIGQSAKLTFTGSTGQRVFVNLTGITARSASCPTISLVGPTGSNVASKLTCSASDYFDTTVLPADGSYTFVFNPGGPDTGNATIAIWTVAADSSTAVNADGSPTTVTTSIGQSAKLTFTGTSGQRVFVNLTGITARSASCPTISLVGPTGSNVASKLTCSASDYFDTTALPADGSYTFVFNPGGPDTGNATIAIYTVPADSSTAVNADGTATTVTTSIGQSAKLTFTGSTGQRVFVNFSNITARASTCPTISLVGPTGSNVTSKLTCSANDYLDTTALPADGSYTVVFNPGGPDTGNATIAVYTVPADSSTAVNADGTATTVTTSVGQSAKLTFAGTAGQRVFITFTGITARNITCPTISLVGPTGSNITSKLTCSASDYFDTTTLPSDGSYTVVFNPGGPDTGNATIAAYNVPADSSTAVNADGTPSTISTSIGQSTNLTFAGTTGQRIFVNISNNTAVVSLCEAITLLGPTGSTVSSNSACGAKSYIDTTTLPATGTYTLRFNPGGTDSGSATVAVYTVPADSSTAIGTDGTPVTITTSIGQSANLTFAGTANQKISIGLTNDTAVITLCAALTLLGPTGSTVSSNSACGASSQLSTITLPSSGTYTFRFNPGGPDSGSATIAISTVTSPAAPLRATASANTITTNTVNAPANAVAAPARRTDTMRPVLDDRRTVPNPAATRPAAKPAAPAAPHWISTAASSRDTWLPSRSNLAGTDWLSHRTPAPSASLPPLAARPGVTALAGQVLTVGGTPLPGVTLSADGHSTRSDGTGRFLLTGISGGQRVLLIDGGTASTSSRRFGIFQVAVHTAAGRTVPLGYPIWLTKLDLAHASTIPSPTTRRTVLTTPEIPGFQVILPAGTVVRDLKGQIVRQISITPVPTDRPPFPLPDGVVTPAYFTVQPGGSYIFPQGAQIVYPNSLHARPGSRVQFYNYDPNGRGWYIYGGGSVTADGKQVMPDPGVKVWSFTGAMINIPGLNLPAIGQAIANALAGLAAADPVDPGTGLFSFSQTDLAEPDTLPITLTRSYRQMDNNQFAFGQGFNWTYGMYQWSAQQYQQSDLVFPNGSHIHFVRTSSGTGWADAVFRATNGWGDFANAVMKWNGRGWDVTGHTGLTYVFGENQPLQSIRDRYGNQLVISRAGGGQSGDITQVTSPHGLWIRLSYNSSHRVTQAVDNAGRTVSYSYDANGRLSQVTDATGDTTSYTWDSSNRLLTVTDAQNHTIASNTYDSNSRVASQRLGTGGNFTFGYTTDANNRVTQTDVTDPDGHVTRYTFNADGAVTSKTLAAGTSSAETWSYTLAPTTDYLSSVTDPLGHQTSYTYDSNGNITSTTQLAGTSSARTTTFDTSGPYGQLASVTDPLGHQTSYTYDAMGGLASVTNPASQVTSYTYAADGQLASVANTTSDKVIEGYNPLGQLVSSTDPLNRVIQYWSDAANRQVVVTAADGGQSTTSYDAGNHVSQVVDAAGRQTGYGYNADGQLTSVTDAANHTTTYSYDADGRPAGWAQSGGASVTRTYDPAGNLASITDGRGKTTSYNYDTLNRPSSVQFGASGGSVSYGYDAVNRLTSLQDSVDGTTSIGYDDLGEPTTVSTPQGSISYSYDAAGRRSGMTVAGGTPISYGYTAADALASITQGSTSVGYSYDTDGRLTSIALPGATQSYAYDDAGQISSVNYTSGSTTLGGLNYSYDPVGRVVGETGSWARLALPASMTATYNAANEPTAVNGVAQSYDGAGNLTDDGTNSYSWNDRGQLFGVTGPGVDESYGYGPSGLRNSVTSGGSTTSYLWDRSGNQVAELSGGSVSATDLTGLGVDRTLVRTDANGSRSQLTDRLGSVIATTDASGTLQSQFGYTPFGEQAASGESIPTAPGFTGRTVSSATGLQYNRDRYYNPALGRFISQDPIGQNGGLNTYAYAGGDPVNALDPSGDAGVLAAAIALAVLTGGLGLALEAGVGLAMEGLMLAAGEEGLELGAAEAMGEALAGGEAAAGEAAGTGEALADAGESGTLRHYTTQEAADSISQSGSINPGSSGKTWLTPDEYASGADARANLALNKTPDGYFDIPAGRVQSPSAPSTVQPAYGQPGGGTEITTGFPIDVTGLPFFPFGG